MIPEQFDTATADLNWLPEPTHTRIQATNFTVKRIVFGDVPQAVQNDPRKFLCPSRKVFGQGTELKHKFPRTQAVDRAAIPTIDAHRKKRNRGTVSAGNMTHGAQRGITLKKVSPTAKVLN